MKIRDLLEARLSIFPDDKIRLAINDRIVELRNVYGKSIFEITDIINTEFNQNVSPWQLNSYIYNTLKFLGKYNPNTFPANIRKEIDQRILSLNKDEKTVPEITSIIKKEFNQIVPENTLAAYLSVIKIKGQRLTDYIFPSNLKSAIDKRILEMWKYKTAREIAKIINKEFKLEHKVSGRLVDRYASESLRSRGLIKNIPVYWKKDAKLLGFLKTYFDQTDPPLNNDKIAQKLRSHGYEQITADMVTRALIKFYPERQNTHRVIDTNNPRQRVINARSYKIAHLSNTPTSEVRQLVNQKLKEQNDKCALTGIPFDWSIKGFKLTAMSVDQIVPRGGYTAENIQLITAAVNRAKLNLSQQSFINLCKAVASQSSKFLNEMQIIKNWLIRERLPHDTPDGYAVWGEPEEVNNLTKWANDHQIALPNISAAWHQRHQRINKKNIFTKKENEKIRAWAIAPKDYNGPDKWPVVSTKDIKIIDKDKFTTNQLKGFDINNPLHAFWLDNFKMVSDRSGNITMSEAWDKINAQKWRCAVSGIPFNLAQSPIDDKSIDDLDLTADEKKNLHKRYALSPDRIDPKGLYTNDNVQYTLNIVNIGRGDFPLDLYIDICKRVAGRF